MDPDKALEAFLLALADREPDGIREHGEALAGWIERGGFAPDLRAHLPRCHGGVRD